ncbi:PsbP-related protein [Thiosocius teredinicola]|uniref:PsbP-related protein n=1 Tax=Thiosocius teredinicola TaxID=1973002 RepID=UPI0009912417
MPYKLFIVSILALLLGGCAGTWTRVDNTNAHYTDPRYELDLPDGWVRVKVFETLYVTRDGVGVQQISVAFREHEKAFENSEQDAGTDLLPAELADRYIAEMKASDSNGLPSLEVLSNSPSTVDGHDAFRLHVRFVSHDGLRYERIAHGFATDAGFYLVTYQAPTLHFFERDQLTYQQLLNSFKAG